MECIVIKSNYTCEDVSYRQTPHITDQRRNRGEIYGATSAMVGQNLPPPGWNRVKASENLGATAVAPVAPAVTSLAYYNTSFLLNKIRLGNRLLFCMNYESI